MTDRPNVTAAERPFTLTFRATSPGDNYRSSYPISSREAQRLIDEYPIIRATRNRVVLRPDQAGLETIIQPATLGGGYAFEVSR